MSKTMIICLVIFGTCTLAILISNSVTKYHIDRAYKTMRKLRGEE